MRGEVDAFFFDMNGIIVDDEPLHEAAFVSILRSVDYDLSHASYLDWFVGRTDKEGLENFDRATGLLDGNITEFMSIKADEYQRIADDALSPYEGVYPLLDSLKNLGFPVGLVTSSIRAEVVAVLHTLQLDDIFDVVVCAEDVANGQPSPEPYMRAAELLGIDPTRCVAFEDTPMGVTSVKAAGAYCVAVTTTHEREDLENADEIVPTLFEWKMRTEPELALLASHSTSGGMADATDSKSIVQK